MKRLGIIALICAVLVLCAGCEKSAKTTVFAMDTVMEFEIWGEDAETATQQLQTLMQQLEQTWSATKEDSQLNRFYRGEIEQLEEVDSALLESILTLSEETGGAFDPLLFGVSDAWGFYDEQYRVPTEDELSIALEERRWDLGGVIKGYAGQQAAELLSTMDIDRAVLNLGGNIQVYGQKADGEDWSIGIQNPAGGDPIGTVSINGTAAVVTSGDYQRYFEADGVRYHHIMDPQTGMPAKSGLSSVTVISWDGMRADALSTALFVMGLEDALEFWRQNGDFEAVFITEAGNVYATQGAGFSGCDHEVIERVDY